MTCMNRRRFLLLASLLPAVSACALGGGTGFGEFGFGNADTVLDVARRNGSGTFGTLAERAGLGERLGGSGPFTIFAPTDAAFRAAGLRRSDEEELRRIIGYHIVPGQIGSSFMEGLEMNHLTASGATLSIDGRGDVIRVNDSRVLRTDLVAGNGVVHIIDRVLRPE